MKKRIRTEAELIEFFSLIEVNCVALADYNIMVQYILILVVYSSFFYFFSSLLAHLSLQAHKVSLKYTHGPSSVVVRPHFSNIFSSETAWPIKAKFYVEPPLGGGTKVYINDPGHITKMAATPIYGKNPSKIFFSRTGRPIFTKLGM